MNSFTSWTLAPFLSLCPSSFSCSPGGQGLSLLLWPPLPLGSGSEPVTVLPCAHSRRLSHSLASVFCSVLPPRVTALLLSLQCQRQMLRALPAPSPVSFIHVPFCLLAPPLRQTVLPRAGRPSSLSPLDLAANQMLAAELSDFLLASLVSVSRARSFSSLKPSLGRLWAQSHVLSSPW